MKIIYTDKNLIDVLPKLSVKDGWSKCGLCKDNIRQVPLNGLCHSFIYIENESLFNDNRVCDVTYLTIEESDLKYNELKELYDKKISEDLKSEEELANKIDILQAENNRLKEVEKEQDKMIIDNSYKMAMIEANLGGM